MNEEEIQRIKNEMAELQQQLNLAQQQLTQLHQKLSIADTESIKKDFTTKNIQPKRREAQQQNLSLENFIGLRIIHLVGIVVLLIGISIGVKYAIDKNLITPLTRIMLAYTASVCLFILSLILKKKYTVFSAVLFSGAMVSAYFTTYSSFVYYNFLNETTAFIIMAAFAVFATLQSLKYNLQEIAILAMVGAYAIPLLISSNHENYVLLFCYILLMNVGVVYVSFKRSWKSLNLLALLITWSIFVGWLFMKYNLNDRFYALIFLAIYYVLFTVSVMAFNFSKQIVLSGRQLFQIMLNNFALYISLLAIFDTINSDEYISTVTGFCAVLFLLFALIGNSIFKNDKALNKLHYLISLLLIVLFVSLKFSGLAITMLWLLIAVIVFVLGIVLKATWPRLASIILLGFTLLKLILADSVMFTAIQKIIAYITLGVLLLVLSFFYQKFKTILFENEPEK